MPRTIAILGTGLMGASLGLALGTASADAALPGPCRIIGYDASKQQLRAARSRLAIDVEARSAVEAVKDADIVILATPIGSLPALMQEIAPHLRHGTLVTDVCSTKQTVMAWASEFLPATVAFVGGHPMAGSEQSGAESAATELFQGAIYCLSATASVSPAALDMATALVETVGARPYFIDAYEHDVYVAGVSHLPFLLSTLLVQGLAASPSWEEMKLLAASGFRDVSRLASGDPTMHRDICLTNPESLTHWINTTINNLFTLRDMLATSDREGLQQLFEQASTARESWLTATPNQRPGEGRSLVQDDFKRSSFSNLIFGDPKALLGRRKRPRDR